MVNTRYFKIRRYIGYWIDCEKSFKNINNGYEKEFDYEKFDEVIHELNTIFSF